VPGAQTAIARRAAALICVCEQAEAEMVAGGTLNLAADQVASESETDNTDTDPLCYNRIKN
jgi:hypothetical protein